MDTIPLNFPPFLPEKVLEVPCPEDFAPNPNILGNVFPKIKKIETGEFKDYLCLDWYSEPWYYGWDEKIWNYTWKRWNFDYHEGNLVDIGFPKSIIRYKKILKIWKKEDHPNINLLPKHCPNVVRRLYLKEFQLNLLRLTDASFLFYVLGEAEAAWKKFRDNHMKESKKQLMRKEQEETDNVVAFTKPALIKTSYDDTDENWLIKKPPYTIFYARVKGSKTPVLDKYMVAEHFQRTTELYQLVPTGQQLKFGVVTLEFSRSNTCEEDLGVFELVYNGAKEAPAQEEETKKEE